MSALAALGRMLGMDTEPDYDILHNERAARVALSRRNLLLAGGAMAMGRVLVPSAELVLPDPPPWTQWQRDDDYLPAAMAAMAGHIRAAAGATPVKFFTTQGKWTP